MPKKKRVIRRKLLTKKLGRKPMWHKHVESAIRKLTKAVAVA